LPNRSRRSNATVSSASAARRLPLRRSSLPRLSASPCMSYRRLVRPPCLGPGRTGRDSGSLPRLPIVTLGIASLPQATHSSDPWPWPQARCPVLGAFSCVPQPCLHFLQSHLICLHEQQA